ncbi:MAG: HD domain-containing protein [Clostridia bacterium]|nr:HD domain-containing protein [Clostridia bacterium]
MFEQLSDAALHIISRIENSGYSAFICGATVRELVMNETPAAYVMITDAEPARIKAMFRRTLENRERKNAVTVIENKTAFDIYCRDSRIEYSRDSDEILKSILMNFDCSMNAMLYNKERGLIDYFGGLDDVTNKTVRMLDSSQLAAAQRPIRMLRAVRYCAQLGFGLDDKTAADIKRFAVFIKRAPSEKIREELDKILMSDNPGVFTDLNRLGILKYIIPELDVCFSVPQKNKYHIYNVGEHIVCAVMNTPNDPAIRWAALLHDIGKPLCKSEDSNGVIHFYGHHRESVRLSAEILRQFKTEPQLAKEILLLIENHDVRIEATPQGVKRMMMRTGADTFAKLLLMQEADNRAKNMKYFPDKMNKLNDVRRIYKKVVAERHPYRISDLAVNGRDLNKLGFRPGHEIWDILQMLLDEVLIDPGLNTREYLLSRAKQYKRKRV